MKKIEDDKIMPNHLFPNASFDLYDTDPEFMKMFQRFAFEEVINQSDLDRTSRLLAILATTIGCQGTEFFQEILPEVISQGLDTSAIKEVVYQAVAYLGMARVYPFLIIVNQIFTGEGIQLPLKNQATTAIEDRLAKGVQKQVDIFGEQMRNFYNAGPEETRHINRWLAENCFGDYYTRGGLETKQREMITFCFLLAQGGCEPQLISHIKANFNIGNNQDYLIKVLSQCIPYIGYPRSLNALNCIREAAKQM